MEALMSAHSPETSLSLLDRARDRGDGEAWQRLVTLYTSLLHAWLRAAGVQPADRDDLTQRVLEVLVRRLPHLAHNGRPGAFRAWLRGITINLLRELWRRRHSTEPADALDELADPNAPLSRWWDEQH